MRSPGTQLLHGVTTTRLARVRFSEAGAAFRNPRRRGCTLPAPRGSKLIPVWGELWLFVLAEDFEFSGDVATRSSSQKRRRVNRSYDA
jgi:hypothetical protein